MAKAAKTEKRRFVPPMPIADLWFDPRLMALPSAGYGIVRRLLDHFWMTECRPLPISVVDLRAVARANPPTWRAHEATILAILHDFCPELEHQYHVRINRRALLAHLTERSKGLQVTPRKYAAAHPKRKLDTPSNYAPNPGVSPAGGFRDRAGR